jgi:hypothetical protein
MRHIYETAKKLHNNTLNVAVVTVPAKPKLTQQEISQVITF